MSEVKRYCAIGHVVKNQHGGYVKFDDYADLEAERDRYLGILRFLHASGPTPEGFGVLEEDCYEYACRLLLDDDDDLQDDDPRWFEGWLRMIEDARAGLAGEEKR